MAISEVLSSLERLALVDTSPPATTSSRACALFVADGTIEAHPEKPTLFSTTPTTRAYIDATFGKDIRPDLLKELNRVVRLTEDTMDPELEAILRRSCEEQNTILVKDWYTSNLTIAQSLRVQPSIWLAGQIIASEPSLRFYHAFLFGPKVQVWRKDGKLRENFYRESPNDEDLTHEQRERVISYLQEALRCSRVEFKHRDPPSEMSGSASPDGVIEINANALDAIPELDFSLENRDKIIREWVLLAYTITHELTHRVHQRFYDYEPGQGVYSIQGGERVDFPIPEMTFEHDEFAEMGYAYEKFMVGGALCHGQNQALMRFLPNPGWLDDAPSNDPDYVAYPFTPGHDREEVAMILSPWPEKHFDPEFWAEEMPRTKGQALKVSQDYVYQWWYANGQDDPDQSSYEEYSWDTVETSDQENPAEANYGGWPSDSMETTGPYGGSEVAAVSNEPW